MQVVSDYTSQSASLKKADSKMRRKHCGKSDFYSHRQVMVSKYPKFEC